MSQAGAIRAGGAYVEVFANDSKFQQAMTRIRNSVSAMAQTMQRVGTGMSLTGAGLGAPMVLAARQAAGFEDAILGMQGAAGLSAEQVKRLSDEARRLGGEMGVSPTKIAQSFLELTKAGMDVETVLAGAGRSAVEFARISGVESSRAAVFMNQAMNVFGVSASGAVDTLTAAANSSETSIEAMVESFSQVGSTGANFGQSLFDISQAFAVLAKSGIVGEEAGTAVKTMLTKLVAPTQDAEEALARLGLSVADFRSEAGELLSMQQIAGVFEQALQKMGGNALDIMTSQQALVDVFEQRGIKVMTAFANAGVQGFKKVGDEMVSSLPVSEQFAIAMSGITGQLEKLNQSVEEMSIAFGKAIAGPLKATVDVLREKMAVVAELIEKYPMLATAAAGVAAGLVAIGTVAIAASLAMKAYAMAATVALALSGPKGWATLAIGLGVLVGAFAGGAFEPLTKSALEAKKAAEDAKKAVEDLKNAGKKNSVQRSEDKKPLDPAIIARAKAAEELAKEDAAFEQQQADARVKLAEMSYDVPNKVADAWRELEKSTVDGVDELRQAAFDAGARFQAVIADIQDKVDRGVLNAQGAQVLAGEAMTTFEEALSGVRDAARDNKTKEAGFGPSLGTFATSGEGIGIGPELSPLEDAAKRTAEAAQRTAENTQRAADALDQIMFDAEEVKSREDVMYEEAKRRSEREFGATQFAPSAASSVGGSAAAASLQDRAAAARSGLGQSLSAGMLGDSFATALAKVVSAIEAQTKITAEQNPLLKQIAKGVETGGLAFS